MLKTPTAEQIADIIESFSMSASADEIALYRELVEATIAGNAAIDELPDDDVQTGADTRTWERPEPADNPFNAWYVKTNIGVADGGRLAGRSTGRSTAPGSQI